LNIDYLRTVSLINCNPKILGLLTVMLLLTSSAAAWAYEVLVIDIAGETDTVKIEHFRADAERLNGLHLKGYPAVKPYFNVLTMANRQVYFVFGFRDRVQGIHRNNYDKTVRNLRRIRQDGERKYPNPNWVSVEEIRRLLPQPGETGIED
jgi:hypothetical protein